MTHTYPNWTPALAARVGYLVGLGQPFETIARDPAFAHISPNSLKSVLTRWELRPAVSTESVLARLTPEERIRLVTSAYERGIARDTLLLRLLRVIVADNLIDAILDDESNNGCGEARRVD